ncbi:uncharacterized protein LOC106646179, partial [Copidosoma floridanum]|uniref:uncharacterized protein LOC106646179 n=1 Tax=Copidosoma floridanum TaxID=29053 RepID=UPI0006C98168
AQSESDHKSQIVEQTESDSLGDADSNAEENNQSSNDVQTDQCNNQDLLIDSTDFSHISTSNSDMSDYENMDSEGDEFDFYNFNPLDGSDKDSDDDNVDNNHDGDNEAVDINNDAESHFKGEMENYHRPASGTVYCYLSKKITKRMKSFQPYCATVFVANGKVLAVQGIISILLAIRQTTKTLMLGLVDELEYEAIFKIDFLKTFEVNVDYGNDVWRSHTIPWQEFKEKESGYAQQQKG